MKERKRERKRKEEGREREIDSNWPLHLRQGFTRQRLPPSGNVIAPVPSASLEGSQSDQRQLTCKPSKLSKKQMNKCWFISTF